MNLFCANVHCQRSPLSLPDGRIEIKAALPANWSRIKNKCVKWKSNGEAAFHVDCWSTVLKMARSIGSRAGSSRKSLGNRSATHIMKQAEKLMIVNAAKSLEKFDSMEDIKSSAQKAAELIRSAKYCIAFTGAGISTSAGLGDFRGKSGKWTEEDQSGMGNVIQAALQMDASGTSALDSSAEKSQPKPKKRGREEVEKKADIKQDPSLSTGKREGTEAESCDAMKPEPPSKKQKLGVKVEVKEEPSDNEEEEEEPEENVDYENLRPTYTHEALNILMERGLMHYLISQNCDGLHLLSGISPDHISELHGNVFMERCPSCEKRYSRHFYVLQDEVSRYYEELEDCGETAVPKPRFAKQCNLCGLCHRTGRRCEEKGCSGYLEDTIINFRDNLEDAGLDRALDEAGKSDIILCLGTTLMVTPACDIVEETQGKKPLIICNRQKTAKDHLAQVRVFGDCDFFMTEVLTHLLDKGDKRRWEEKRGQRMEEYNLKRETVASQP
ncbi:hypothetical protein ACOMHN_025373 [Nucella lapillus]